MIARLGFETLVSRLPLPAQIQHSPSNRYETEFVGGGDIRRSDVPISGCDIPEWSLSRCSISSVQTTYGIRQEGDDLEVVLTG